MNSTALTAQAEQIADAYLPEKRIPDRSHLTRAEDVLILKLHAEGKSQVDIAAVIGCSQPTVSRTLAEYEDTSILAKYRVRNSALKLVDRVIADADVDQSLEVLDRIGVLEKRNVDSGRAGQVNIVIGMPGQPAGPDVTIDVSPLPFAPQCPEVGQSK